MIFFLFTLTSYSHHTRLNKLYFEMKAPTYILNLSLSNSLRDHCLMIRKQCLNLNLNDGNMFPSGILKIRTHDDYFILLTASCLWLYIQYHIKLRYISTQKSCMLLLPKIGEPTFNMFDKLAFYGHSHH